LIEFSEAFGKNELRVLYLGTITEDRGCLNIIDAVVQLKRKGKFNITLDLIGPIHDSFLKVLIQKRMASNSNFIRWKDAIPYSQVVKEITNYDVGFAALHDDPNYRESLPTKLLEYNAAGLFSIVSNLPISHRYVTEDVNAIIVEPNNTNSVIEALNRIWDKKLYQNRKVISELTAAKYSWNSQFHILKKCYFKILGR
jgi:glycosyltransferase involved in cell wall biosynthesis